MSLFLIWFWGFTLKAAIASQGFFHSCITCSLLKVSSWTCYRGCSQQTRGQVCGCRVFYLLLTGFYFTLFRSLCAEVCWQAVQSVCSHAYIHATGAVIKWSSCHMLMSECSNLHHTLDFFLASDTNEKHFCFGDLSGPIVLFLIFCHI